jgi:hypothetical protein
MFSKHALSHVCELGEQAYPSFILTYLNECAFSRNSYTEAELLEGMCNKLYVFSNFRPFKPVARDHILEDNANKMTPMACCCCH